MNPIPVGLYFLITFSCVSFVRAKELANLYVQVGAEMFLASGIK